MKYNNVKDEKFGEKKLRLTPGKAEDVLFDIKVLMRSFPKLNTTGNNIGRMHLFYASFFVL